MDITETIKKYADKLLDLSSRNKLINLKDSKSSTAEIIHPRAYTLFDSIISSDDDVAFKICNQQNDNEYLKNNDSHNLQKDELYKLHETELNNNKNLLFYNINDSYSAIRNIYKKNKEYLNDTGNNLTYLCFGLLNWTESKTSKLHFSSPLLLVKATIYEKDNSRGGYKQYILSVSKDEVIINSTLKYKLKNEFDIDLPEYKGESLNEYLYSLENIVSDLNGEVEATCKIFNCSYLRLNMHEDLLKNIDKIRSNKLISNLLGDSSSVFANEGNDSYKISGYNALINLHNVIEADSSQIEAIEKAKSGISFVLQGPPGTGKSQTITNIISELLYDGKKVLFVSEKLAALEVVYANLKKCELDNFCLRLHDYRTNKQDFYSELQKTLNDGGNVHLNDKGKGYKNKYTNDVKELETYLVKIDKKYNLINMSISDLYSKYYQYRNLPDVKFVNSHFTSNAENWVMEKSEKLTQFIKYEKIFDYNVENNFWYGIDLTNKDKVTLHQELLNDMECLKQYYEIKDKLNDEFLLVIPTRNMLSDVLEFYEILKNYDFEIKNRYSLKTSKKLVEVLTEMSHLKTLISSEISFINNELNKDLIEEDCISEELCFLEKNCKNVFRRIFNATYSVLKKKYKNLYQNKKINYTNMISALRHIQALKNLQKEFYLKSIDNDIHALLGKDYREIDTNFDEIVKFIYSISKKKEILREEAEYDFSRIENYISNYYDIINNLSDCKLNTEKYIYYKNKFNVNFDNKEIVKVVKDLINNIDSVDKWKHFLELYNDLLSADVYRFITVCRELNIESGNWPSLLKKCYYKQWIDYVISNDNYYINFDRSVHDKMVDEFRYNDSYNYKINQTVIKEKINTNKPNLDVVGINSNSSPSNIIREANKKRKQKSIKIMMENEGKFIQSIKPCFLMSPLSVSTFLSGDSLYFDTVIFDEASQIFPEDALCSIYRGKQVIVVGDTKQMPPTNFFMSDFEVDDSEDSDVGTYESILDLSSSSFPQVWLKWHYRSRCEELISFSNKYIYNNRLVTFKSAKRVSDNFGVTFRFVDNAIYDNGKNVVEAKKVVKEIISHFDNYGSNRSLGVVAFGIKQQEAIENELEKFLYDNPKYEEFVKDNNNEPFFVKNLETIQGDERDTIIFSIGYGKSSNGIFSHNFGPLSRQGGERRLNVAITRAKINNIVVSSIRSIDINLSKIHSEGGKLLHHYLDYAENGMIAIERDLTVNSSDCFDSEFEMDVCEFLRNKGFDVDTQVGSSGYKIDLALKRPNSSDYFLAIECDGASYHSSKNARDRDKLRQQVLENLGWKFYRIWSTDWYLNNMEEKESLLNHIHECLDLKKNYQHIDNLEKMTFENKERKEIFDKYKSSNTILDINDFGNSLKKILEIEAPLCEKLFLKRYATAFGRDMVTKYVKDLYNRLIQCNKDESIIIKEGFLYLKNQIINFRLPGDIKRTIDEIAKEELAAGMFQLIKNSKKISVDSLFKQICHLLKINYSEKSTERLAESAKVLKKVKPRSIGIEEDYYIYIDR